MEDLKQIAPTPLEVTNNLRAITPYISQTPVWKLKHDTIDDLIGESTELNLKLELWQKSGSFKARAALSVLLNSSPTQLKNGVTAVSAGNHAIAVAYAAKRFGTSATVVMPKSANALRVARCKEYGAKVELVEDVFKAFERVKEIEQSEERLLIHPFEGPLTAKGTATIGLEILEQIPDIQVMVVPIGGGGLCAGISSYLKQVNPKITVIGVEPTGAAAMSLSIAAGSPQKLTTVDTIADSLGAPFALPYSFSLCREYVDSIIKVSDDEIITAMHNIFLTTRLAVEPAAAAGLAAICGSARSIIEGKKVALIICGSSIDAKKWQQLTSNIAAV